MTDLFLVRHAETIWHQENRYAGRSDVALTNRGRAQASRLGSWAVAARIDTVITSPLSRCRLTAAPAATAIGRTPIIEERLIELHFGSLEGKTKAEARALFPGEMAAYLREPVANHFSDGESPRAAAERGSECLHDIATRHANQRVLVIGHSTLTRLALCEMLGIELNLYRRRFPVLLNCGVTQLRVRDGDASLIALNLPPETLQSENKDSRL